MLGKARLVKHTIAATRFDRNEWLFESPPACYDLDGEQT